MERIKVIPPAWQKTLGTKPNWFSTPRAKFYSSIFFYFYYFSKFLYYLCMSPCNVTLVGTQNNKGRIALSFKSSRVQQVCDIFVFFIFHLCKLFGFTSPMHILSICFIDLHGDYTHLCDVAMQLLGERNDNSATKCETHKSKSKATLFHCGLINNLLCHLPVCHFLLVEKNWVPLLVGNLGGIR